jgi:hypothetical protein
MGFEEIGEEEDFAAMLEESFKNEKSDRVVEGVIVDIKDDYASVDVGKKIEGRLPVSEIKNKDGSFKFAVGDKILVAISGAKNERPIISHKNAVKKEVQTAFAKSVMDFESRDIAVEGVITKKNKGGFVVEDDNEVEFFLPNSLALIKKDEKARFETVMHSDGSMGGALTCENSIQYRGINDSKKTFVSMNGQEVFRFAVRKVPECIEELISKMKIEKSEIDLFLLHQANKRILESIGKRLKVSMDLIPENVSEYGNTSSASIPILLDEMVRDGKIQKGNKIIMAGFGAGLTWSAVYLEF